MRATGCEPHVMTRWRTKWNNRTHKTKENLPHDFVTTNRPERKISYDFCDVFVLCATAVGWGHSRHRTISKQSENFQRCMNTSNTANTVSSSVNVLNWNRHLNHPRIVRLAAIRAINDTEGFVGMFYDFHVESLLSLWRTASASHYPQLSDVLSLIA